MWSVVGARPQFVKASIVDAAFQEAAIAHEIVHTGQHFDENMSDVFFGELRLPMPRFNLAIRSDRHGDMTGRMLAGLEELMIDHRPAGVIVYGDTNTTLAAALAAAKLHIPVAHVEAGMRSGNRMPEEINRIVTDRVSDILFTASAVATHNLEREGVSRNRIHEVGDVMYDCALRNAGPARDRSDVMQRLGVAEHGFVLCTLHRAENTDDVHRLRCLLDALALVHEVIPVVMPMHPRTRAKASQAGLEIASAVHVIEPVGYLDMVRLEMAAAVIATDSGGVQREAFFHRRPCVTLRDETEWPELIDLGWNVLAPASSPRLVAQTILGRIGLEGIDAAPYGDGNAGKRIARILA
ncbi:MAG: non-hydrolyzing UDP-N-acetylglucosamine 2-epimerase [Lautropia sp.]